MPRTVISLNEDNSFSSHHQYSHNPYAAPQQAPSYGAGVIPNGATMMNPHYRQANAGAGFNASTNSSNTPSAPSSQQSFYGSERSQNSGGPSYNGSDYGDDVISQEGGSSLTVGSESIASFTDGGSTMARGGSAARGKVDPSRFKTETCSFYQRGEPCPYSPFCAFAHGDEERRSRRRNVREGVTKVNTLPRHMVYHEVWVQTTKYTRKTGPSEGANAGAPVPKVAAPPAPSFIKSQRPTA